MDLFDISIKVYRSFNTPIRINPDYKERWNWEDKGLITAWEIGRELAISNHALAIKAKNGELPKLGFKGGYEKTLVTNKPKHAPMLYLAKLQGLKGEDLNITQSCEGTMLTCSATGMKTIFTFDTNKYKDEA